MKNNLTIKLMKRPVLTTIAFATAIVIQPIHIWAADQSPLLKPAQAAKVQSAANTPPPVHRARLGIGVGDPTPEASQQPALARAAATIAPVAVQGKLEMLSDLIKVLSSQNAPISLNLCFAGVQDFGEAQIMQGAAIAEGLALRAGYVPVLVSHSSRLEAGKFNVLIGTVDQIAPILSPSEKQSIKTGWIALKGVAGVGPGPILIVSGKTENDLENAIISLGLVREPYPIASSASIKDVVLPSSAPFFRREPLHLDTAYTFQQLQEAGVGLSVPQEGGLVMEMFLPGDFPVNGEGDMALQLHYQMKTTALSAASALDVKVNGKVVAQIHGDGGQAAFFGGSGSATNLPMSAFSAGRNLVEIVPAAGAISSATSSNLQIYGDSTLTVPKSTYVPTLPDLRVTCSTFYPFIGQPDGSNLAVLLTDRKPETIDAALTLMAKLAQQCNTFLFAAQIGFSQLDPTRHVVVIGEVSTLPEEYRSAVPVAAFGAGQLNIPLEQLNKAVSGVNLKQVIEQWVEKTGFGVSHKGDDAIIKQQQQSRESFGYMTCKVPVEGKHGWALLLTAYSPEQLRQQTYNVVNPAVWDLLKGDLVRWQDTPASVQAHVPGQKHISLATRQFVEMPFGERINLRVWLGAVAVMLIICGILSAKLLGKLDQLVTLRQRRL